MDTPYLLGGKDLFDKILYKRKSLSFTVKKLTLLGRPVVYIKVALSNINVYFTWGDERRENNCTNNVMSE